MENIIVTSFDHGYFRLGLALICSINENTINCPDIIILDSGLTNEEINCINNWASNKKQNINIISVYPELFKEILGSDISIPSQYQYYSRLLIPYLVPLSVKNILYLDADIICVSDLKKIFNLDLGNNIVACCQDVNFNLFSSSVGRHKKYNVIQNFQELGFSGKEKYFNSGVLLIKKDLWISNNVSKLVLHYTAIYEKYVFLWDQYGLNIVLNNKWQELHQQWNEIKKIDFGITIFRHFIKVKPISYSFNGADKDLFFYYLDIALGESWRPSFFAYLKFKLIRKFKKVFLFN